jgi:hypothetical protein
MPIVGTGMLLTSMDIDAADEAEFNRWYDFEHLEERVAIDGFLEARRYVADRGSPKYLCLYSTSTIDVFDGTAYKTRLANPTAWSKRIMAQFKNMIRSVARITISRGNGRGAALGVVRLRPTRASAEGLRAWLGDAMNPRSLDGIVSMHLIESDPVLSGPLTGKPSASDPTAGDWFVLIDATGAEAASAAISALSANPESFKSSTISTGIYRLMWDLAKSDIPA